MVAKAIAFNVVARMAIEPLLLFVMDVHVVKFKATVIIVTEGAE